MYSCTIPFGAVLLAFNTQFFHCIFGVGNFAKNLPNIGKGWEIVCYLIQIYIKKKETKNQIRHVQDSNMGPACLSRQSSSDLTISR